MAGPSIQESLQVIIDEANQVAEKRAELRTLAQSLLTSLIPVVGRLQALVGVPGELTQVEDSTRPKAAHPGPERVRYSDTQVAEWVTMFGEGTSINSIAQDKGTTVQTVRARLIRAGAIQECRKCRTLFSSVAAEQATARDGMCAGCTEETEQVQRDTRNERGG